MLPNALAGQALLKKEICFLQHVYMQAFNKATEVEVLACEPTVKTIEIATTDKECTEKIRIVF